MFLSSRQKMRTIRSESFNSGQRQLLGAEELSVALFESENDLLRFLLNFPRLRVDRRSPVFLSDQRAAELGFVDC
jgi:hypothetical protein